MSGRDERRRLATFVALLALAASVGAAVGHAVGPVDVTSEEHPAVGHEPDGGVPQ